jgi:hypothetical protein
LLDIYLAKSIITVLIMQKDLKMIVNAGDVIRSYDFKPMVGRDDCFVEGTVNRVTDAPGYKAYEITVTKDSWTTEGYSRVGEVVFVPARVAYNDYAGRVMNLSRI